MKYYYDIRTPYGEYTRGNYYSCLRECRAVGIDRIYRYELHHGQVEIDTRQVHFLSDPPGTWE